MKINKIDLFHTQAPLLEPWHTAYGKQEHIESLFVKLHMDDFVGWSEVSPAPTPLYNPEYAAGAYALACDVIAPLLLGNSYETGSALQAAMAAIKGNEFAKSAFDCAWWDAYSKSKQMPLWRVIGGKNQSVPVGADLPVCKSTEHLVQRIGEAVDAGFLRVKLKFNKLCSYETIAAVRTTFPSLKMHIDCNSGYTLADIELFKKLDKLELAMIEQPLGHDDLIDHATLQRQIATPICLDESITSVAKARKAIDTDACRWVNIKTSRVGGLTNAIAIHDLCAENEMPVWVGGMLESTVGQGCSLALATMGNVQYPSDIFPSSRFYPTDIGNPEITHPVSSHVQAPNLSGHGFTPKMDTLKRFTVQESTLVSPENTHNYAVS